MIQRGQISEASKLLERLRRSGPPDPDVEGMWADIKEDEENRRAWRYMLNLNTGWRRMVWASGAGVLLVYGIYCCAVAAPIAYRQGLNATITTQVQVGGRYRTTRWAPWTRPIWSCKFETM